MQEPSAYECESHGDSDEDYEASEEEFTNILEHQDQEEIEQMPAEPEIPTGIETEYIEEEIEEEDYIEEDQQINTKQKYRHNKQNDTYSSNILIDDNATNAEIISTSSSSQAIVDTSVIEAINALLTIETMTPAFLVSRKLWLQFSELILLNVSKNHIQITSISLNIKYMVENSDSYYRRLLLKIKTMTANDPLNNPEIIFPDKWKFDSRPSATII